jgi:type I restriction enzyme R subunit
MREHEDNPTIRKLRENEPLSPKDLRELERILIEAGVGSNGDIQEAKKRSGGFGQFVRSLVGMDRAAARKAFAAFLEDSTLTANQIEFVELIVDHLTAQGAVPAERLYESPFIDISPTGPNGIFTAAQVQAMNAILTQLQQFPE